MLQYYTMEGENGLKKSAGNLYLRIAAKKYEKLECFLCKKQA